jgi:hypothetical protein
MQFYNLTMLEVGKDGSIDYELAYPYGNER